MKIKDFIPNKKQESSGQIVILLAVSLLALLVVAALAIDGGMLYSERRFSQNAADASSLAAAAWTANRMADQRIDWTNFNCSDLADEVQAGFVEAKLRAASNNFSNNLPGDMATNFYIDSEPALTEANGMAAYCWTTEKHIDFKVRITTETSTAFLHLISPGTLKSTVEAVTRLDPQHNIGFGNAIVSLNDTCSNTTDGLRITGTTEILISGGGLWSNDCLRLNGAGAGPNEGLVVTIDPASAGANLIDPAGVNMIGGAILNADQNIMQSEDAMDIYSDAYEIKSILEPICNAYPDGGVISVNNNQTRTLPPGRYARLTVNGGTLTFTNPNDDPYPVYCFDGAVSIGGGVVTSETLGDGTLSPVIIYLRNGNMSVTGGVVTLMAPDVAPTYYILEGLLIFMDPDDSNDINLEGNGSSFFSGTVFALDGDIDVGGTANATSPQNFSTQLIGTNVQMHGNTGLDIQFDLSQNVTRAPTLNLLR